MGRYIEEYTYELIDILQISRTSHVTEHKGVPVHLEFLHQEAIDHYSIFNVAFVAYLFISLF